jgi:ATP-dependent HslUV protease, peptidase subunit HslV
MSTLVAVRKGGYAVIAADTQYSQGTIRISSSHKRNHNKIYKVHDCFVGFTGWLAMINIFESVLKKYPKNINFSSRIHIFETLLFLHRILKEEYYIDTKEKDNQPVESSQWDGMAISKGGIFAFGSYREVSEYEKYWAEGSGLRFAIGAMHSVYDRLDCANEIAVAGVNAAAEFDDGSSLPCISHRIELK